MITDTKLNDGMARAIVDTVHEPLLVLDKRLRVVAASRSFYKNFALKRKDVEGQLVYELGDHSFNIPALRLLLEKIIPERTVMDGLEMEHDFADIGTRRLLLNARRVVDESGADAALLLAIEDITDRRANELEKQELLAYTQDLLQQKNMLLDEMRHRVGNSLQIIASILSLKARAAKSDETRHDLQDAHRRVLSVATVQQHLHDTGHDGMLRVGPYMTQLCESLSTSMIGEAQAVTIDVDVDGSETTTADAVSLGLIVTEVVINALKHAFPNAGQTGHVVVSHRSTGKSWRLSVSDNGVGQSQEAPRPGARKGLGTNLVQALAQQLNAEVTILTGSTGTAVSIAHDEPAPANLGPSLLPA